MSPGLDDVGIERLRAAIAPLTLPDQVETMFRWHDGTPGLFCGWRMRGVEELLRWRRFCLEDLGEPPAWLQLLDDRCLGFVTLGVQGIQPDPSLWYCHSHDTMLERLFDSLEKMVVACGDLLDDGKLAWDGRGSAIRPGGGESLDERLVLPYRLARGTHTFVWPDPPAGSSFSRMPEPGWLAAWLISLGMYPDAIRPLEAD